MKKKFKVCVVGLGYVGMPLAVEFSKKYQVFGYDKSKKKIENLNLGIDDTQQYKKKEINNIFFSNDPINISESEFIIVCIPTPVDKANNPDLKSLKLASQTIGKNLTNNSVIIYESTVYPGATEDVCLKILKKNTKLKYIKDYNIGYSPERVNPGDKKNTLKNIAKIISGNNKKTLKKIDILYKNIVNKVYPVSSIRVAEASKVIENTQRDVNIGLINEFSLILNELNLNVKEVLDAARSKWNFLKFEPGLVGGHCIGVDPYYLAYVSKKTKIKPKVILSSRDVNEGMTKMLFNRVTKNVDKKKKILIFGLTFKENCPDLRNSKNLELVKKLISSKYNVTINDEFVNKEELSKNNILKYSMDFKNLKMKKFDLVLLLVKHNYLIKSKISVFLNLLKKSGIIYDFKNIFSETEKKIFKQKKLNYLDF
jgi:UDP-N-acetyl-D-glucosamine/UDP-N-acetyl-D-galactosamine dehydrogenase